MLDVFADGCINVAAGGCFVPKGGIAFQGILIVKGKLARPERIAVTDVFVDVVNARQATVFPERDEGGVQCTGAFIKLLMQGKPEAEGICPGEHDLTPHHGINIREKGCGINEVFHEGNLIYEEIAVTLAVQLLQILIHVRHCVGDAGFYIHHRGASSGDISAMACRSNVVLPVRLRPQSRQTFP